MHSHVHHSFWLNIIVRLLSEEYRTRIRSRCMTFLHEEDDLVRKVYFQSIHSLFQLCLQIAECNEVIVAKIARLDYPHNWYALLYET